MFTTFLIISIYIAIIIELILDDSNIVVRYLHFGYMGLFVVACLVFFYLLLSRSKKLSLFIPAFIFITVSYLLPFFPSLVHYNSTDTLTPVNTPTIKVLSFSVNSSNKDYQHVTQLLRNNPADIICLQEIPYSRYTLFLKDMKQAGLTYHHVYSKRKSLMILAKQSIALDKKMPFLQATANINGHSIKIWNLHSPKSLTNLNYQRFYFDTLYNEVDMDQSKYKLLCGDFNSTPHNDILPLFMDTFHAAYKQSSNPISMTYPTSKGIIPSPIPLIKIDYLLFSHHIKIDRYQRIAQYAGSDHYPISATVSLMQKTHTQTEHTEP